MPLNSVIEQKHLAEVEGLKALLSDFISRWQRSRTEEERRSVEADAIALFEKLIAFDIELQELAAGDRHLFEDYSQAYGAYRYLSQVNLAKLRKLTALFIKYFNSQQIALAQLVGQLKRVRQKRAALALWSEDESKFVLADHFLNFDYLDTTYTSVAACNVETNQGVLTLPVEGFDKLNIKKVSVGSNSNGVAGNSDVQVTTNNLNPAYAVNGDPNNWFEYERLDAGPLKLAFKVEMAQEEIVNQLEIQPVNLGNAYAYVVEDIVFTVSGKDTVSIHDLVNNTIDRDAFTVKSAGNDTVWQISFVPVRAKTITIKFAQPNAHQIEVANNNRTTSLRNRWSIGIKALAVRRVSYQSTGGINSTVRTIPAGLYVGVPFLDFWPPTPELYDASLELSFDGGESWQRSDTVDDGVGKEQLMNGTETSVIWRFRMDRDASAVSNATSFLADSTATPVTETVLKTVSRNQSPAEIFLPTKPKGGEVYVYQPRLGRRGDRFSQIRFGQGTGTKLGIELPFSPLDFDVDPDEIRVFVNRSEYGYNPDNDSVSTTEWAFSTDYRELEFSSDTPAGGEITAVLDEERMCFEQRSDGYYHKAEMPFDPDKNNLTVRSLPREGVAESVLLPRDRKIIRLGTRNIVGESFKLTAVSGLTLTEVVSRANLLITSNSYLVDYQNGIVHLNAELGEEIVRASYIYMPDTVVDVSQFDVVFDGARPWGVRISPDAFKALEHTDTVSDSPTKTLALKDASYSARADVYATSANSKTLSYDRIVKGSLRVSSNLLSSSQDPSEVEFIDGRTEFLGLIPMNREETAETVSDVFGDAVFKLSAGALWHESIAVLFDNTAVFATLKASVAAIASIGDYYVANDGTVTVRVGAGGSTLSAGIRFRYYYQDPNFDPRDKYSVDYKRGALYSYFDLNAAATITYKVACYNLSYDVVGSVQSTRYDRSSNSVQVFTENLAQQNSLVKVVWVSQMQDGGLKDFEQYFTPMVSVLGLRFN